jgi:hypothetical protein
MRLLSWFTAINVLVACGFSLAGLVAPQVLLPSGSTSTEASLIFAMYAAARSVPLALVTLAVIYKRSVSGLLILGTLAGLIQISDVGVGLYEHDPGKSVGPLVIALVQFYAVFAFHKSKFNQAKADNALTNHRSPKE